MDIFAFALDVDPRDSHERAMKYIINHPNMKGMKPVTERTVTKLTDRAYHISAEGFGDEDPHTLILVCSPTYPDQWMLYSICPRSASGTTTYKIKTDRENAIRVAQVIIDISFRIIPREDWMEPDDRDEDDEDED
jgi:hypothetical protein